MTAETAALRDELKTRRRWDKESEALLTYLCHVAGVQMHTCYPVTMEKSHPEDDHRIMVETGDNGSGEYVMVKFGFDSNVAKLVDWIAERREAELVDAPRPKGGN